MPHCTSISADGSVNGKNDGRKRVRVAPKKRSAKRFSVDFRSTKLMPSSTQRPSICGERRRVRRVEEVAAIHRARDEHADRRRVALQRADLHRRRVRAQQRRRPRGRACRARPSPGGSAGSSARRSCTTPSRPRDRAATVKPSSRKIASISSMTSVTGCLAPRQRRRAGSVRSSRRAPSPRAAERRLRSACSDSSRVRASLKRLPGGAACRPWRSP